MYMILVIIKIFREFIISKIKIIVYVRITIILDMDINHNGDRNNESNYRSCYQGWNFLNNNYNNCYNNEHYYIIMKL